MLEPFTKGGVQRLHFQFSADTLSLRFNIMFLIALGDADFCKKTAKCGIGEGDCDNDDECQEGLICVEKSCDSKFADDDACCQKSKQHIFILR